MNIFCINLSCFGTCLKVVFLSFVVVHLLILGVSEINVVPNNPVVRSLSGQLTVKNIGSNAGARATAAAYLASVCHLLHACGCGWNAACLLALNATGESLDAVGMNCVIPEKVDL